MEPKQKEGIESLANVYVEKMRGTPKDRRIAYADGYSDGYTAAKDKGVGMKWVKCSKETNPTKQGWYLLQAPDSYPTQVGRSWFDGYEWNWSDVAKQYILHQWDIFWLDESPSSPVADKEKLKELVEATLIIGARRGAGVGVLTHDTAKELIQQDIDGMTDRFIKLEKQTL